MISYDKFKSLLAEIILYSQTIEHDLKQIYAIIKPGLLAKNLEEIKNKPLGFIINELAELDSTVSNPYIGQDDYEFLRQMSYKRNYWVHKSFLEFIYLKDWEHTKEYDQVAKKLVAENNRFYDVYANLEQIRIQLYHDYRR